MFCNSHLPKSSIIVTLYGLMVVWGITLDVVMPLENNLDAIVTRLWFLSPIEPVHITQLFLPRSFGFSHSFSSFFAWRSLLLFLECFILMGDVTNQNPPPPSPIRHIYHDVYFLQFVRADDPGPPCPDLLISPQPLRPLGLGETS